MFKLAAAGIVTWPTEFPDLEDADDKGFPKRVRVPVRYRVFTRAELKERDERSAQKLLQGFREEIQRTIPGETAAAHSIRITNATEALAQSYSARDAERERDLFERVLEIRLPGADEWKPLARDTLAALLVHDFNFNAFETGLVDASRMAIPKN